MKNLSSREEENVLGDGSFWERWKETACFLLAWIIKLSAYFFVCDYRNWPSKSLSFPSPKFNHLWNQAVNEKENSKKKSTLSSFYWCFCAGVSCYMIMVLFQKSSLSSTPHADTLVKSQWATTLFMHHKAAHFTGDLHLPCTTEHVNGCFVTVRE